eukprot:SAG11_NODE_1825_length_4203_cov_3.238304_7_plen_71_part_00
MCAPVRARAAAEHALQPAVASKHAAAAEVKVDVVLVPPEEVRLKLGVRPVTVAADMDALPECGRVVRCVV